MFRRTVNDKKILAIGVSVFLIVSMVSCSKNDEKVDKYETKTDTIMNLTAYGPNATKAIDEAFSRVDEIENLDAEFTHGKLNFILS